MQATEDPRLGLQAKDLATRAAALRYLSVHGGVDDLDLLLDVAHRGKRTGERLGAAAAIADIVVRCRTGAADPLSSARRARLHEVVRTTDPGANPGILMVLAGLADRTAMQRLGRLLRDPRNDVRAAAAVAVRRLALSHAEVEDVALANAVGDWMNNRRTPADAMLELMQLIGEVGWSEHEPLVRLAAGHGRKHAELAPLALERLASRRQSDDWNGLWVGSDVDVLEQRSQAPAMRWLVVGHGHLAGSDPVLASFDVVAGLGRTSAFDGPLRRIWAPRLGLLGRHEGLQGPGFTLWRVDSADLVDFVNDHLSLIEPVQAEPLAVLDSMLQQVDGPLAIRARGMLAWRLGQLDLALELLTGLSEYKRPRNDVFYWLGRVYIDAGDTSAARAALERFLEKAGKRADFVTEAEALLADL